MRCEWYIGNNELNEVMYFACIGRECMEQLSCSRSDSMLIEEWEYECRLLIMEVMMKVVMKEYSNDEREYKNEGE